MKRVVIGGSGPIAKELVNGLRRQGHEIIAASPSTGANTMTGEGLAEAHAGAQPVVDMAYAPSLEDETALELIEKSAICLSPAPCQPIAPDDVAVALADLAVAPPLNGTIEILGPENLILPYGRARRP